MAITKNIRKGIEMDTTLYGTDDMPEIDGIDLQPQRIIDEKKVAEATEILNKYKQNKSNLESRIVEDELWWELRHWEAIGRKEDAESPNSTSAWLFNSIMNKHADAMDNYPSANVLPRERTDEESAKTLSSILPVILENNGFDQVYSDNWWEKLKHGTGVYGIFWDSHKDGIGDIDIKSIDLLNIFWESGVTDIQDSRNLFIVNMMDNDILANQYPEIKDKLNGDAIDIKKYIYDDNVDTTDKSVVVDWYYKVSDGSRTILHYCKFCAGQVLFATENEPEYRDVGFYEHGLYPVVFDTLFPEKGTPVGFGYVSLNKNPQIYIDDLSNNILESSKMGTKKRFFASNNVGVNEQEFLDWSKPIVHVEGQIDDTRLREIQIQPISPIYLNVIQQKVEEMKETSANRDVNSGGSGGGITAASAISALQESGNKASRDMLSASYRAYTKLTAMVIELIRQFYDESRSFRITGDIPGQYDFVDVNNEYIKDQVTGIDEDGNDMYRKPIFDLKISAQKKNPFSRMEENERAKELYAMGFFAPEKAQESMMALEMMDFEGIEKVKEKVAEGQTLLNIVQQMSMQLNQMSMMMGLPTAPMEDGTASPGATQPSDGGNANKVTDEIMASRMPQTPYQQRLAKRSKPSLE